MSEEIENYFMKTNNIYIFEISNYQKLKHHNMQILKSITLENFRVFRKVHKIELKPITILIGPNSSGKSSVIKSLILSSNNSSNKLQNLDFTGPKHNLGTIQNTINSNSQSVNISIGFEFIYSGLDKSQHPNLPVFYRSALRQINRITTRGNYQRLVISKDRISTNIYARFSYLPCEGSGELTQIEYFINTNSNPFIRFQLNDGDATNHHMLIDFDQILQDSVITDLFFKSIVGQTGKLEREKSLYVKNIIPEGIHTYRVSTDDYNSVDQKRPIDICQDLIEKMIASLFKNEKLESVPPMTFRISASFIPEYISLIIENLEFAEAVRANTRRIYTNDSQGTTFNELILEFNSRKISKKQEEFINKWLSKFQIADHIEFNNIEGVATSIFLIKNNKKVALADLGFGVTQIIPLILKIAMESPREENARYVAEPVDKLIMLEEPETNLHPKLQSLLADFLSDATRTFALHFIVETHSEYLVRKLQIMVADENSDLDSDEVNLYYFNSEEDERGSITRKITILENGSLSDDFGNGFWDEATRLQVELMKLKRNKNE